MADRKRTSSFSFAALLNSEEKQKSAAHTSSYITWQCTKYNHSPSSFSPLPSLLVLLVLLQLRE